MIDDPAYYAIARQIARAPFDPYGFDQFWYSYVEPANHILAPAAFPYWLGIGMKLFGDDPQLIKFWLYPVFATFSLSWFALLRRFARNTATPILLLTLASPVLLPNANFMLDVPALALSLAAMVMFLHAMDRHRLPVAIAASLVAGLAAQTKYTGGLSWPMIVFAAAVYRPPTDMSSKARIRFACAACVAAVSLFVAWELFVRLKYGESHFLYHLREGGGTLLARIRLAPSLLLLLGGMLPPAACVVLLGLRWQRLFVAFCALTLCGYALILSVPGTSRSAWALRPDRQSIDVATVVFAILGALAASVVLYAAIRQVSRWRRWLPCRRNSWIGTFLSGWLLLEIAGYFALTPFAATRRIIGITLVATLIAARLLSFVARKDRSWRWLAIAPGMALGIFYNALCTREAGMEPDAVRKAVAEIREQQPSARIWYVGHWGVQFEAQRCGLLAVVLGSSQLERGDWLIWPDPGRVAQQEMKPSTALGGPVRELDSAHPLPLRLIPAYYGGHLAVERWPHPQLTLQIYRVRESFTPPAPD
jgi:hypothetical protein